MRDDDQKWERFLIRDQFFELYFENISISEHLNVQRLTDLYEITRNKDQSYLHFAIVRYTINQEIQESGLKDTDQIRRQKKDILDTRHDDIYMMYPEDANQFDDSINFLSLAFSGLANINEKKSKLFKKTENSKNYIKKLIETIKSNRANYEDNKFIYKEEIMENDKILKSMDELRQKHNNIVKNTIGDLIDKIPLNKKDLNSHYSLFFLNESTLFEFTGHDYMIREVQKNISNSSIRSKILDEIQKTGDDKLMKYQNDITIFSENEEQVNEDINLSSEGTLVIVIISILFIINFFDTNPQQYLYDYASTINQYVNVDINTGIDMTNKFQNLNQTIDFLVNSIIPTVYNNNTFYQNLINMKQNNTGTNNNITNSSGTNSNKNIVFFPKKYYPYNTNILCGILVSFNRIKSNNQSNYIIRNGTFQFYKPSFTLNTESTSLYTWDTTINPFLGGSFNIYIKPYLKGQKLEYQKYLLNKLKEDTSLNQISYTIMLYNTNVGYSLVYNVNYEQELMSEIKVSKYHQCFNPFINLDSRQIIRIYIDNIIYLLGFLYVSFLVARNFSHHLLDLFKSKKYSFELTDWIDLSVLVISFSSQVMFYKLFIFNFDVFPIQINDKQTFSKWLNFSMSVKFYNSITGFAIFFIMIRLVKILYTAFPNFGIVFQTLSLASKQVIAFIILLSLVIFGVTMISYLNFSWYSVNYMYIGDSIMNIFLMSIGNFDYGDISNNNKESKIVPYFFTFFMFFYNLILINIFLLTIRNNYAEVKEKDQKYNEAFALMLRDKSIEFQNKLFNFLICGDPADEEEKTKLEEINDKKNANENMENDKENQKRKERERIYSKIPIWTRMNLNFERLNIKQLLFGGNIWNREEFEINMKKKYKELEQNGLVLSIEDLVIDYEKEFDQLSDTVIYLFYIIIFVTVIIIQLDISNSADYDLSTRLLLDEKYANFSSIIKYDKTKNVLQSFVQNMYNISSNDLRNPSITFNPNMFPSYVFLKPPYFRVTLRILNYVPNPKQFETVFFPFSLAVAFGQINENNCGSDLETTKEISINNTNVNSYPYYAPYLTNHLSTPDSCGGFVYLLNKTNPFIGDLAFDSYLNSLFDLSVGFVVLDFVILNKYYNTFVYVKIEVGRTCVGVINFSENIISIPINLYSHLNDYFRLFFEIVYLIFFFYYAFILIGSIITNLKKYLIKDFYSDPEKEKFRNSGLVNQYFRVDLKSRENDPIGTAILFFLWKFIERFISFAFFLINSIIDHLKRSAYNILDLLTFILSMLAIKMWIDIINATSSLILTYREDFDKNSNSYLISEINDLSVMYTRYIFLLSINIFLYVLKLIRYFRFSKSIYNIVKIFDIAKNTFIFHIIFVSVIYLGFVIWGYALFGQQLYEFSTISHTILELWTILAGSANYMAYVEIDNFWTIIYIISFIFIISLIMLNILSAIVIETYKEIKYIQEQNMAENNNKNFLETVIMILKQKYNIFLYTTDGYYKILVEVYENQVKNYIDHLEKGISAPKNKNKQNKNPLDVSSFDNFITVFRRFMTVIDQKTRILEKIALRMLPFDCYTEDIKPENENDLMEKHIALMKKQESISKSKNKITKYEEISIFLKIFAYIIYKIQKNNVDAFSIEDILIYLEEEEEQLVKKVISQNRTNGTNEITKINKIQEKKTDENTNKFLSELMKDYKNSFEGKLEIGFMNSKLFEKEKKLRLNKRAGNNISYNKSHMQFYRFYVPKKNRLYNIDFVLNCDIHESNKKYDFSCTHCYEIFANFYNTYVIVYDLLVKYFYIPEKFSYSEKEMYVGYYLCEIPKYNSNFDEDSFNNKKINEYKYEKFKSQLEILLELNKIENTINFMNELDSLKKKDNLVEKDYKFDKNFLKKLYKKYIIWNAIYLILLKKYPYFIKEIKDDSVSNMIISNSKKENGEDRFFLEFFKKIFNLEYEVDNQVKTDENRILQTLREYVTKTQKKIESFDLSNRMVYEKKDRFMILDQKIYNTENNIPEEPYTLSKKDQDQNNDEAEFEILVNIWDSWKVHKNSNDQFFIFFGCTKFLFVKTNYKQFKKFFIEEYLTLEESDKKIYKFFNDRHRGEILKSMKFSSLFVKNLIKKLIEFRERNNLNDGLNMKTIITLHDVLKYIGEMKLNYMKYYDLIMSVFDKHFRPMKNIINDVDKKYYSIFNIIKFNINKDNENMYPFIDYFKLFISMEKYKRLSQNLNHIDTSNNFDSFIEEIEEENGFKPEKIIDNIDNQTKIKKEVDFGQKNKTQKKEDTNKTSITIENENIVYAFSLDPFQLVDVLRNIEDSYLREFYMLLMNYMFDDMDFSVLVSYLERETQFTLFHKYKHLSTFLLEKEIVKDSKDKYENEKNYFTYILNYSKFMKEKVDSLSEMKEKTLNKIKSEAQIEINKIRKNA